MSTLIAVGYPDETTADEAAAEARRLAADLVIQPDAIAVIKRDRDGQIHVTTNHHAVAGNVSWGMFWGLLFGLLFFIPLFGMVFGAGLGALMGLVTKMDIDKAFQRVCATCSNLALPRCSSSSRSSPSTRRSRRSASSVEPSSRPRCPRTSRRNSSTRSTAAR